MGSVILPSAAIHTVVQY